MAKWQPTLDLDLRASIVGVQLAARAMINADQPGTIIAVSSASGVYAFPDAPVYCAAKAGLVQFVKAVSLPLSKKGIHIASMCPQFVDTALVANTPESFRRNISTHFGKLMTPETVVEDIFKLAQDKTRRGKAALIFQDGTRFDWDGTRAAQRAAAQSAKSGAGFYCQVPLGRSGWCLCNQVSQARLR